ncbi:MAG: Major facilitator superfamily MFS_1 [Anaerolineaceae bacterium 46_22]|nr:MAG: Major facilitator superfamily MFS_1 [Anaerolineaceae bacterium 46_22]
MKTKYKIYFFFQYLVMGVIGPYLAVFLYEKGYSGAQIGLLLGAMPITILVFQPLWSYLSDVFNTRKRLLFFGSIGAGLAALALGYAPSFWLAFVCAVLLAAMQAPLMPISTALVLDYLEETQKPDDYSLIRLWGSLAFAVSSMLIGGLFIDQLLTYFVWLVAVLYFLQAGLSLGLSEWGLENSHSDFKSLDFLIKNPSFAVFLLGSVFIGATINVVLNYQTLFLQFLGASSWMVGSTIALQALIEIPMMAAIPFLLKRFSMRRMIFIGAMVLPIRWLSYIFIKNPNWVLPTQILHSVAVVGFMVIGVSFIDKHISPKWRATGQGLYNAAMSGIGAALGAGLAGMVFEWFDIRAVWLLNLIFGLIGLGLLLLSFRGFRKSESPE